MEAEAAAKRARETAEDTVAAGVGAGAEAAGEQAGISAVIPGWFSEISPMWPGASLLPVLVALPAAACSVPCCPSALRLADASCRHCKYYLFFFAVLGRGD